MPELPEVETIKRGLAKSIVGLTISKIEILSKKNFIGDPQKIIGQKITTIERKGKMLIIKINKYWLIIHLKMTGQLIYET